MHKLVVQPSLFLSHEPWNKVGVAAASFYTAITHKEQNPTNPTLLGTPVRDPLRNFPRPQGVVPVSLSLLESNMADDLHDEWWLEEKEVEDIGKFFARKTILHTLLRLSLSIRTTTFILRM